MNTLPHVQSQKSAPQPTNGKHKTPAMQRRAALLESFRARGHGYSNLWLAQSIRVPNRSWILTSDAEFFHFHSLEFAPDVRTFELTPPEVIVHIGEEDRKTRFDAIVDFVDGRRECREVKVAEDDDPDDLRAVLQREAQVRASERLGGVYVRVSGNELAKHRDRFWNSVRMLRCIHAAEGYAIQTYRNDCGTRLTQASNGLTIAQLLEPFPDREAPLALAAVFRLLSERLVAMDIESEPIYFTTVVRIVP